MLEGCVRGIEESWFQGRISDSAYELERTFNSGERIVVGVNDFLEGNDDEDLATLKITHEDERHSSRASQRFVASATTNRCAGRSLASRRTPPILR